MFALFVLLPLSSRAQMGSDVFRIDTVKNSDIFVAVAEVPDQSALLGMATGTAGLIALRSRQRQRSHRTDSASALTGPLRRLQPAFRVAPDRMGNPAFAAPRLAVTPRRIGSRK